MELDKRLSNEHMKSLEHLMQDMEWMPCEIENHDEDFIAHYGEAEWYMIFKCGHCPASTPVIASCNGFRDWVMTKGHTISCPSCGRTTPGWDAVTLCKPIERAL